MLLLETWILLKFAKSLSAIHSTRTSNRVTLTRPAFYLPANALHQQRLTGTQLARLTRNAAPLFHPSQWRLQRRALENMNEAGDPQKVLNWKGTYTLMSSDGTISLGPGVFAPQRSWGHRGEHKLGFCQQGLCHTPAKGCLILSK